MIPTAPLRGNVSHMATATKGQKQLWTQPQQENFGGLRLGQTKTLLNLAQ